MRNVEKTIISRGHMLPAETTSKGRHDDREPRLSKPRISGIALHPACARTYEADIANIPERRRREPAQERYIELDTFPAKHRDF